MTCDALESRFLWEHGIGACYRLFALGSAVKEPWRGAQVYFFYSHDECTLASVSEKNSRIVRSEAVRTRNIMLEYPFYPPMVASSFEVKYSRL